MILYHYGSKQSIEEKRQETIANYEEKRTKGTEVIKNFMAEVVDFRDEFATRDVEHDKVIELLNSISPEQYIKTSSTSASRKVQL